MPSTSSCDTEKAAWTAAAKKLRANERKISRLHDKIGDILGIMGEMDRPQDELDWAMAMAEVSSGAEARSEDNQRMARRFELRKNTYASEVLSLAAKLGDAVEKEPVLDSDQAATNKAYRECINRVVKK